MKWNLNFYAYKQGSGDIIMLRGAFPIMAAVLNGLRMLKENRTFSHKYFNINFQDKLVD